MWIVSKELCFLPPSWLGKQSDFNKMYPRLFGYMYMPYMSLAKKAGLLGCLFHNHIAIISGA